MIIICREKRFQHDKVEQVFIMGDMWAIVQVIRCMLDNVLFIAKYQGFLGEIAEDGCHYCRPSLINMFSLHMCNYIAW